MLVLDLKAAMNLIAHIHRLATIFFLATQLNPYQLKVSTFGKHGPSFTWQVPTYGTLKGDLKESPP